MFLEVMAYRSSNEKTRLWRKWVLKHQDALDKCGIPLGVLKDEDHWWDFLQSGFLERHHDPTKFSFDDLSEAQKGNLRDFLEAELTSEEKQSASILRWLKA